MAAPPMTTRKISHGRESRVVGSSALAFIALFAGATPTLAESGPLTGSAAFGDWRADRPGLVRLIRPIDLPKPGATASSANVSHVVPRPPGAPTGLMCRSARPAQMSRPT